MSHKREPVRHTCPDIDDVITLLEKLRKSNEALRNWGEEEADRVDELEAQIEDLQKEIDRKDNEIGSLQDELDRATE